MKTKITQKSLESIGFKIKKYAPDWCSTVDVQPEDEDLISIFSRDMYSKDYFNGKKPSGTCCIDYDFKTGYMILCRKEDANSMNRFQGTVKYMEDLKWLLKSTELDFPHKPLKK